MMRKRLSHIACVCLLSSALSLQGDWLTFGHDTQRSGWAPEEVQLSVQNVKTWHFFPSADDQEVV